MTHRCRLALRKISVSCVRWERCRGNERRPRHHRRRSSHSCRRRLWRARATAAPLSGSRVAAFGAPLLRACVRWRGRRRYVRRSLIGRVVTTCTINDWQMLCFYIVLNFDRHGRNEYVQCACLQLQAAVAFAYTPKQKPLAATTSTHII